MPVKMMKDFFKFEAASGIFLMFATVAAIVIGNSPLAPWYDLFLDVHVIVGIGSLEIAEPLLLWINDALSS